MNTQFMTSTRHYHFRQIRPGIFAALARPEGLAASNCGLADLGDFTVVIDTSLSPQAGIDVRDMSIELTGRDVDVIFLTHHHFDHVGGAQAFGPATAILASAETNTLLAQSGQESLLHSRDASLHLLASRQESLKNEKDAQKRAEMTRLVQAAEERLSSAASTRLRMPDVTSQGKVSLHGTKRRVEFIPLPRAHCPGNALVHLPDDGVLFAGDLLFARRHPFLRDGDPQGWLAVLDQLEALRPEVVVPGHGGVSSLEEIHMLREYLQWLMGAVHRFVQDGKPAEALGEIELPEPFAWWEPKDFLMGSLNFLYDRFTESGYVQSPMFDLD